MSDSKIFEITPDTEFETVVGLEVHAQLTTNSKAFAPVSIEFGKSPNTNVTPLCLGHPGTLPVPNENLIRYIIKMGLATNCSIAEKSIFARKNYFYPDMPKGYQISQFENPICENGHVMIDLEDGSEKKIGITRIHMEEDAGKSIHDLEPHNTLIDLNRAGTPLIEIVSEPDIRSPQEAYAYLSIIKRIVQYLGVCDGNMEEGSLRCDANVSIRPKGSDRFGTRTEIKNLNSFKNVERAITYEVERQREVLISGGEIIQQTLLWDPNRLETRQMRSKEEAHDYRYFPEPDIPPVVVTADFLEEITSELPELPTTKYERFVKEFGLPKKDANIITENQAIANYFEEVVKIGVKPKSASNVVLTEVMRVLNESDYDIQNFPVEPVRLASVIQLKEDNKISSSAMQTIFNEMLTASESPEELAKNMNLIQVSDTGVIEPLVDEVLDVFPDKVNEFVNGRDGLMGFFVGQIMKKSQGKANPKMVNDLIRNKIQQRFS